MPSFQEISLFGFNHSGGSYATNMLLELDLCIYSDNLHERWITSDYRHFELREESRSRMGGLYPRFMEEGRYVFPHAVGFRYNHDFPAPEELAHKSILLVRDPRDVLLSIHNRQGDGVDLCATLNSNLHRHGPNIAPIRHLDLYPGDCWAVYYSLLREVYDEKNLHIVRFEDIREDPTAGFHSLLGFAGLQATSEALQAAHERSSKSALQRANGKWRACYPQNASSAEEVELSLTDNLNESWTPAAMQSLGALAHEVMASFGYNPGPLLSPGRVRTLTIDPSLALEGTAIFRAALEARIAGIGTAHERVLELGLCLRACTQIEALFGGDSIVARRALAHLVTLYGKLEGRPLHLLSAARGFEGFGAHAPWRQLLQAAADSAQSFGERADVARECYLHGDAKVGRQLLKEAQASVSQAEWEAFRNAVDASSPTPALGAQLDDHAAPYVLQGPVWQLSDQLERNFLTGRSMQGPQVLVDPSRRGANSSLHGVLLLAGNAPEDSLAPGLRVFKLSA